MTCASSSAARQMHWTGSSSGLGTSIDAIFVNAWGGVVGELIVTAPISVSERGAHENPAPRFEFASIIAEPEA